MLEKQKIENKAYRDLFKTPGECVITLEDLFNAVKKNEAVFSNINRIFSKKEPIAILIEGSAYTQNIKIIAEKLTKRNNAQDQMIIVDIGADAVAEHSEYLRERASKSISYCPSRYE